MEDLIFVITQGFLVLTSIFGVYLAAISLCCLIHRRSRRVDRSTAESRLAQCDPMRFQFAGKPSGVAEKS